MQHVAQTSESDIKLETEISNVPKVGNSSTPSSPRSPPCSPPCTPPDTPPDRFSDSFQCLSDSSESGDEDISEVDSFIIDADELTEEAKARISSKLLSSTEEGGGQTVDPETQARLQSLLKAAGINKFTAGDGKQLADPEVLRRLTSSVSCALDEAAAALTRMRCDSRQANKRALIKACTQGNVSAVRKLLKQGISVNETSDEGESLLSLACSAGYYELAQVLLAMHASVEDRGSKGDCTPLMEASSAGYVDIVRLLLAHSADVNAQSATGNTPLMYACAGGHVQTVRVLLDAGANVEDHNENGHTPLMEAASAGHVEVAKMLLKHGAGINTHSNEFKESALTLACYKGHLDMVNFLLQAGADQEHKTDEMHTALMEASMDGHVEVAKLLLDSGAQVNMPTDSFESPLTLAACGGHVDLAILLIERGANIEEVNDEGYTPLMEAAREGHEDMVAVLLQRGARINAQTEETQETALTLACCGGFIEVADYLIKHGADIELGASTPLMEAAQEGHLELVRYLLEAGANVHAHTQTADTALTYACENGHTDVADLLLQYGAELEHESEGGRTPLMKACRAGHLCTVQFLVSKNADINRRTTNNDHTPLSLACAGGHFSIVQFLLDHGADMFHKLKDNSTMLIEAAKGGHTNVVQLLLDYPDLCNTSSGDNVNVAVPAVAVTTAISTTTNITATATQTATIPASVATDTFKNNTTAVHTNTVVSNTNNASPNVANDNQHKTATNNACRQIATALPKTAMRKLSRDPRLVDWRPSDVLNDASWKKVTDAEECKKEERQITKILAKQPVAQPQSVKPQPAQQVQSSTQQEPQQSGKSQQEQRETSLDQQFQEKLTITNAIDQQVMQSQLILEELQRVEQEWKESGISNAGTSSESSSNSVNKETSNNRGVICSTESIFTPGANIVQTTPPNTTTTTVTNATNTDASNLPPPPPLIPISEVLQSTAISDRPKAKPTKKEGKLLRKQHLHAQQQQQLLQLYPQLQVQQSQLQQNSQQPTSPTSTKQTSNPDEQAIQSSYQAAIQQQQSQALQLKHLAQINAQLQQQVIKNQQQIELHQQQQQLLQQQQPQQGQQQSPELIGSGTLTVATNAPNIADIFNHQELIAQIQQMDSSFAKTFPDFSDKCIDKAMQQESLQRCHFLTSISEDEVSFEDVTNGTITIEEKRLCDVHQHAGSTTIEATPKNNENCLEEKHNYAVMANSQTITDTSGGLSIEPNYIQLFPLPNAQQEQQQPNTTQANAVPQPAISQPSQQQSGETQLKVQSQQQSTTTTPQTQIKQAESQQLQPNVVGGGGQSAPTPAATAAAKQKQPSQLKQMLTSSQQQVQLTPLFPQPKEGQPQQKAKPLMLTQKQLQQHFTQIGRYVPGGKQTSGSSGTAAVPVVSDTLTLNSQARQELHKHLTDMKIAQTTNATHQNQNTVTKCVADSTVSHAATSTQTTVANAIKKKISFDDSTGALTKLAMGKKMRTVNAARVPPNAGVHAKDDGNAARVPSTNTGYNQTSSMDVDSETESNHDTALTLACAGGHEELVELLLSRGADIEHRDKKGFTPLILAATAGHEKVVELLLNHNADIEAQSERTKDTPLSLACSGGRYEAVDLLLARGANKEHRNVSDYTPLSLAASGGYVNIIKLLLSHGAEINSRTGSKLGISPLMLAAMNGHTAAVKLLLDQGSDINAQIETNRNTALTLACFQGRHEVVALLLERKANVEHRAKTGLTPLMEAASGGYVEVGRVLLEKGADVNAPPVPSSRDTALTIASDKGHFRFVELLIKKGAQVEVKNKKGNSPMWLAANGGHLQVIEILITARADIDSQDNRKVSCLMAAFRKGHVKTVTWMVDRVHQFPSDQEMTRYISTINDKELLEKCQSCMKIIRVAKDEQAEKANEYATILLEELDLEKTREEFKKMTAARRKERKKHKKLQKIFEKRKQQESEMNEEDGDEHKQEDEEEEADDDYQPSTSNAKDRKDTKGTNKRNTVENTNRRNNVDNEEGDSGIDANSLGSCSSNEVKVSSSDRLKDKKNKKQPTNNAATVVPSAETNKASTSNSRESRTAEKFTETKNSKKKKKDERKESTKEEKLTPPVKENKTSSKTTSTAVSGKSKNANDATTKTSIKGDTKAAKSAEENTKNSNWNADDKKKNKKENNSIVYEASQSKNTTNIDKDDFEIVVNDHKKKKQTLFNHEDSTIITSSTVSNSVSFANAKNGAIAKNFANGRQIARRGEEEWKEVVRKCLSPTYRVKKVSVPLTAISRVIGRAGCNINAIRSATGAHIEIEKQSKGQGERIITMKGSIEATKQAHTLIAALIDDPELDITQMLPKSAKSTTCNASWEKPNANAKGKVVGTIAVTSSTKSTSVASGSTLSVFPKTLTSTPVTSIGVIASSSYTPTVRTSMNTTRPTTPKLTSVTYATSDKKSNQSVASTTVTASVTSVSSSSTKTTMSYTSAIMMSSGKTQTKGSVAATSNAAITTTTVVSQTFAAKVSETAAAAAAASSQKENKDVAQQQPMMKPPIAPPPPTSTSIFIRPPPTASAPLTLPVTPSNKPSSFPAQTSSSVMMTSTSTAPIAQPTTSLANQQQLPNLPAKLSQQLLHPPPPLPNSLTVGGQQQTKLELPITNTANTTNEEPSPVSAASEYSLFNDTFSKVTQQSMWGRDSGEETNAQKSMNFASVVTASGSPNSSIGGANSHAKFLDTEPPVQVDASKAPGYRGASMCSPNLKQPPPPIRSSVPSNVVALSPSGSLSFSNVSNSIAEPQQIPSSVTAPIARPTSVPSSMDGIVVSGNHTFTPRALFHDKAGAISAGMFARDAATNNILSKMSAQASAVAAAAAAAASGGDSAAGLLSPYHSSSLSYTQPQATTTVSMSRLNPRAPDFSTGTIKPPTVSIPTNQLPPTHQPPPMFNQQSLTANFLSSQLPSAIMAAANSSMISLPAMSGKYGGQQTTTVNQQQQQQRATENAQNQWSLMNAAAQHAVSFSQNDLINFAATPTTLNNLMHHAQNNDMLSGLENGMLTNNALSLSGTNAAAAASLMAGAAAAAAMRSEERKMPPKPIGTERAWRTERERAMPMEQDPNNWLIDQKVSWNQQMFRNNSQSAVNTIPTAPTPSAAPYSCLPQVPDDIRQPILDGNVYQNDHFNGLVQNTVLTNTLPPLLPHMNACINQVGSGPIMQSFNQDMPHPDTFKIETGWDPNRLCMTDLTLTNDKTHPQQSTQPPNWSLSWNH